MRKSPGKRKSRGQVDSRRFVRRLFGWLGAAIGILLAANILLWRYFQPPEKPEKPLPKKPALAIIIDDLGYDVNQAHFLYQISPRITLSVLPYEPYSAEIVRVASARGQECLLHLPMEPKYRSTEGYPKMLLCRYSPERLRRLTAEALDSLPQVVGVNNHMGSRFTEDAACMRAVLVEVRRRGLVFVDSRTTPRTVAYQVARSLGVPAVSRDVFLDNEAAPQAIREQLEKLVLLAEKRGWAVGIGHPKVETIVALREFVAGPLAERVRLVKVSELLE